MVPDIFSTNDARRANARAILVRFVPGIPQSSDSSKITRMRRFAAKYATTRRTSLRVITSVGTDKTMSFGECRASRSFFHHAVRSRSNSGAAALDKALRRAALNSDERQTRQSVLTSGQQCFGNSTSIQFAWTPFGAKISTPLILDRRA